MKITKFYETMYVDSVSYDNIRKISSYIDGLKNSGRKVLFTTLEKNIKQEVKVSRLKSTVSEYTEYLHGEDNLSGVIVTMAKNYVGANNLPLLRAEASFGTRFINEASADRYITTGLSEYTRYIFRKEDEPILIQQTFEGNRIEPRFFVPIIPMSLVNPTKGISSGFSQLILPRKVKDVVKMMEEYLTAGKLKVPKPGWEGFKGTVKKVKENKWKIEGKIKRDSKSIVQILEIPVGIELKKYIDFLDNLQEKKIITSYEDLSKSEKDEFHFKVRLSREYSNKTDEELKEILWITDSGKDFSENLTFIDENNRIIQFDTLEQMVEKYVEIRLEYYNKRKEYLIEIWTQELKELFSKYIFVKEIVNGNLKIRNRAKNEIVNDLKGIKNIIEKDGSFEYLLKMPIYSLTKEKMNQLAKEIKEKKERLANYKERNVKELWLQDLQELKEKLNIK